MRLSKPKRFRRRLRGWGPGYSCGNLILISSSLSLLESYLSWSKTAYEKSFGKEFPKEYSEHCMWIRPSLDLVSIESCKPKSRRVYEG